ncbi:MAG: tRNA (adenosine(37)-N6)-threonylcarbamoyltransferase complex ATPase subunit type 1 TsaE [Chitinophagales bacterium]
MMEIQVKHLRDLPKAAEQLINACKNERIFAFYGEMGTGKTTFVKAICAQLGVVDTVSSPTYALVNEYVDDQGQIIYHFDLYRLENIEELLGIGFEEYLDSEQVCFIEWPQIAAPILADFSPIEVHMTQQPDNSRKISVNL